jgi:hypothetical protein
MHTPGEITVTKLSSKKLSSYASKCTTPSAMNSGVWGRVAIIRSRRSGLNSELAWKITQKLVEYKNFISNDICVSMYFVNMIVWEKYFNETSAYLAET